MLGTDGTIENETSTVWERFLNVHAKSEVLSKAVGGVEGSIGKGEKVMTELKTQLWALQQDMMLYSKSDAVDAIKNSQVQIRSDLGSLYGHYAGTFESVKARMKALNEKVSELG